MVSSLRFTADSHPQYAKTPSSRPEVRAAPPAPNGLSHDHDGSMASSGLSPFTARQIATPAKTSNETIWSRIRAFCSRAEMSVPSTHSQVMTRISTMASGIRTQGFSAASSSPTAIRLKLTPTSASDPTTSTPVIAIAQPPSHPNHGPIARVTQLKVVPQSWSTRLR